ncbi:MAG: transcriptional regulator NrdR [Deltaproteobacteria bacterium]|jgi:transcriptional repressor NrdR|nr:transcriptional regulator NrdR [Deltaproteobacteria bacterium]
MKCQFCDHLKTRVLDSRPGKDNNHIRRRRQCPKCNRRFTTFERLEENFALVVKRDGRMEPFDRNKILAGLRRSCTKLPIAEERLTRIAGLIENRIQESRRRKLRSRVLGDWVAAALQEIHPTAYIRYSMVHRQIQDLQDLQKLLDEELP